MPIITILYFKRPCSDADCNYSLLFQIKFVPVHMPIVTIRIILTKEHFPYLVLSLTLLITQGSMDEPVNYRSDSLGLTGEIIMLSLIHI